MLLKIEKQILKTVCKQIGKNSIEVSTFKKYTPTEVCAAFLSLKEKGYFEIVDFDMEFSTASYRITAKCLFYKEEAWNSFLRNIAIPIAVSFVTSVLIILLELYVIGV